MYSCYISSLGVIYPDCYRIVLNHNDNSIWRIEHADTYNIVDAAELKLKLFKQVKTTYQDKVEDSFVYITEDLKIVILDEKQIMKLGAELPWDAFVIQGTYWMTDFETARIPVLEIIGNAEDIKNYLLIL